MTRTTVLFVCHPRSLFFLNMEDYVDFLTTNVLQDNKPVRNNSLISRNVVLTFTIDHLQSISSISQDPR